MMPAVFFDDSEFELISDTVVNFGQGLKLTVNTRLSYTSQNGLKIPNIKQVRYQSSLYKDYNNLVKISRTIDCYLALEYKPLGSERVPNKVIIRGHSIMILRMLMNDFFNEYHTKFKIINNDLVLLPNNLRKVYTSYTGQSFEFEPDIYCPEYQPNEKSYGVKLIMNGEYVGVYRFEPSWMSFTYVINSINLFQYGANVMNMFSANKIGREVYDMNSKLMIDYYDRLIDSHPDNQSYNNDNNITTKHGFTDRRRDKINNFFDN